MKYCAPFVSTRQAGDEALQGREILPRLAVHENLQMSLAIGRALAFGTMLLHVAHCHQIHER
jgi:ABC-type branched-subunit amino acid transport system ATPase component